MTYVDGFVIPVPENKVDAYLEMAREASVVWMEHGALQYKECVADDLSSEMGHGSFLTAAQAKEGETVVFSFIVYESRAHRDAVNAKVMADPRIKGMCDENNMPFDPSRMAYGGFKALVEL